VTINKNDIGFTLNSGISAFEAKDFTTALRLLSPLADEGIAEAQYRMGMMFQNGLGRVKNVEAGIKSNGAGHDVRKWSGRRKRRGGSASLVQAG
jgi:hypothetical protein